MRSQNSWDLKTAVIESILTLSSKTFTALLDDKQDAMHRMILYRVPRQCIKHMSHTRTLIPDDQLHAMELSIYHGIKV